MKRINYALLPLALLFGLHTARAQCCCSAVLFSLVDKKGRPVETSQLRIVERGAPSDSTRISFPTNQPAANTVSFRLGCGNGREVLSVFHKGAEMRIRFKFHGEFGNPFGTITFRKGTFVAEPDDEDKSRPYERGVRVRKPTAEELKEFAAR